MAFFLGKSMMSHGVLVLDKNFSKWKNTNKIDSFKELFVSKKQCLYGKI